jgi:hypothetical protein
MTSITGVDLRISEKNVPQNLSKYSCLILECLEFFDAVSACPNAQTAPFITFVGFLEIFDLVSNRSEGEEIK